jgi:hypothetical protein
MMVMIQYEPAATGLRMSQQKRRFLLACRAPRIPALAATAAGVFQPNKIIGVASGNDPVLALITVRLK